MFRAFTLDGPAGSGASWPRIIVCCPDCGWWQVRTSAVYECPDDPAPRGRAGEGLLRDRLLG
jgi:hypothetical protein